MPRTARSLLERIAEKLVVNRTTGCLEWTGRTENGYGIIWAKRDGKRTTLFVHRAVFEERTGVRLPKHIQVCHRCDNPRCALFGHLFSGTNADNQHDKATKGRAAKGEQNGNHKLTGKEVCRIREWRPQYTLVQLAKIFHVSPSSIWRVTKDPRYWSHV